MYRYVLYITCWMCVVWRAVPLTRTLSIPFCLGFVFHFPACKSETSKVICLVFLWNMCIVFAVFMSSFSGGVYSSSHAEVWSCLLFLVETQDSGVCSVWGGSPSSHSSSHPSSHCFQLHVETCRNHSTELWSFVGKTPHMKLFKGFKD